MNKVYYLEPDEEITKVIDRIRKSEEAGVVLVVPRGSSISQSIINLKLIKRNAFDHGKIIGLVSGDKITKNLADQVGVEVFSKVSEAEKARLELPTKTEEVDLADVKVNRYKKYDLSKMSEDSEPESEPELEPETEAELEAEEAEEITPEDEIVEEENVEDIDDEEDEVEPEEPISNLKNNKEDKEEEEMVVLSSNNKNRDRKHIRTEGSRKAFLIFSTVIIVGLLIAFFVLVPYTKASLVLKTNDLDKKEAITVSKNQASVDSSISTIPGQLVELEKSVTKEFASTGQKDAGAKAKGTITISNTISTKSVPVSPGAKVTSTDGKIFTIDKGVMVPGATVTNNCQIVNGVATCDTAAGTIDATVTAVENGDAYNLALATKFKVGQMTAENKAAFAGGVTKKILFVTDDDLAKAEVALKEEGITQGKQELIDKATDTKMKIFEKNIAIEIISQDSNKKANDEADKFQITAKVKLSALSFLEEDLRKVMSDLASKDLSQDKMLVNADKTELSYELSEDAMKDGIIKLSVDFKGKVGSKISSADLTEKIKNKSVASAKSYLESVDGVESVIIKSSPAFLNRTPVLSKRIKVDFDYQK